MRVRSYAIRRLAIFGPQLLGVTTVVFVIARLLPGNPAFLLAGPRASQGQVQALVERLGLDKSIPEQYAIYLADLLQGNLGRSWMSGQLITDDLLRRFPATFELVNVALILALTIAIPLGILGALRPRGLADRIAARYAMLAGGLPDFWWGLMLIFIFFGVLHVAAEPLGRIDIAVVPPPRVTGLYTVDSIIAGDAKALGSSIAHLVLPALTLAFVYAPPILKMTRTSMEESLRSKNVAYARAIGLPNQTVVMYAARTAILPVITITGIIYSYLLSGAVLVEQVFGWGGIGQYAVQAVTVSDYLALSGAVLVTTTFSLTVYLIVDLLYLWIDPRIHY